MGVQVSLSGMYPGINTNLIERCYTLKGFNKKGDNEYWSEGKTSTYLLIIQFIDILLVT